MKILHTGDVHLGDLTGPVRDGKNARREDTLQCVRAIVERAERERPDVSIVAGDLFNRSRVWADTALDDVNDITTELIRPLCHCSEHVAVLFGTENHDNPRAFQLLRELTNDVSNLHIYTTPGVDMLTTDSGPVQIVALPGFDRGRLRLFCPGTDKETENRNATALINDVLLGLSGQVDKTIPSVLVAHYTVAGSEADNGTVFLAGQDTVLLPATIDGCGFTLACLGHIHHPQRLQCHTPTFYCGSPNQLTFNDEFAKQGFYIHTVDAGVESRFVYTPARRHFTMKLQQDEIAAFISEGTTPAFPSDAIDTIVRVRYTCTREQDKALNRAELQKALLGAGAFFVADILPADTSELDTSDEMTEHDGPVENLTRWIDANDIDRITAARLAEKAAPIIKAADDGRDEGKHIGAFTPLRIEVKNYRSYTAAEFSFDLVHMAMVNGPNGIGKSSLFMDSIADCLFERSRQEDAGGWVRDGTKSGAITFEFAMGGDTYRVIRTRTKSGRGSLALHRFDKSTDSWTDSSDTTMRLTQQRIERLLGMDYNTFCSIALIRQDAYGLFLEAGSDQRMEVLSALLGLDIYSSMYEAARAEAKACRRNIAAADERLSIYQKTIDQKDYYTGREYELDVQSKRLNNDLALVNKDLEARQGASAMREELLQQQEQKLNGAKLAQNQAAAKWYTIEETEKQLADARKLAECLPNAEKAVQKAEQERKRLAELQPQEEELRAVRRALAAAENEQQVAEERAAKLRKEQTATECLLGNESEIQAACKDLEGLRAKRAAADRRTVEYAAAREQVRQAQKTLDDYVAERSAVINSVKAQISECEKRQELLKNSDCPVVESATCTFLADARRAVDSLPALIAERDKMITDAREQRQRYRDELDGTTAALAGMADPSIEISEIAARERDLYPLANQAAQLEAARATLDSIRKQLEQATADEAAARKQADDMRKQLPDLERAAAEAGDARRMLCTYDGEASKLPDCKAAAATVQALEPRVMELTAEAHELERQYQAAIDEAKKISARILPEDNQIPVLMDSRTNISRELQDIATERGSIRANMLRIEEAEKMAADTRAAREKAARDFSDYSMLAKAFGIDGIQYMIIRGIVPEIMRRANDILASMTGGRMAVDIRTEREQRSTNQIVNSLEVWIASLAGTTRPYLSHSGGEKVKIALAVTLALADVKARRAGVQLGMLFIDEPPFLDADGTEAYADALTGMAARNPNMRVLAISHDPTMKARFAQNITISAGDDGSRVNME